MKNADIKAMLGGCAEERRAAIKRLLCGQGFCTTQPALAIAGKAFCFTGRSTRASREVLEKTVTAHGGTFHPRVTRATDYLVVCSEGSPTWTYATFGAKIRRAAHIRSDGGKVAIISERLFWEACEGEGGGMVIGIGL